MSAFKWTRSILLLHKTTHPIRKFQPVEIFSEFSGWFENGMKSQSLLKTDSNEFRLYLLYVGRGFIEGKDR